MNKETYTEEEKKAWDEYFIQLRTSERTRGWTKDDCAREADAMLAERRKRFKG